MLQAASDAKQINGLFSKIDNLEYFPTEILLQIFVKINDIGLLNLGNGSYRFKDIAEMAFHEKYANKYFVIDGETKSQRELYLELFRRFGDGIKAIEANGIRKINKNHWMTQMLHQYTNQIEKITFDHCSFGEIDAILSQYMDITDLTLRHCQNDECSANLLLPSYRKLKKLELNFNNSGYYIMDEMLIQTFQNNPALESLTLNLRKWLPDSDNLFHEKIVLIAEHLKHLKELSFDGGCEVVGWQFADETIDLIVDSLKHLDSLNLWITPDHDELMRRLGMKCKNIKKLALAYSNHDRTRDVMSLFQVCPFQAVEHLKLVYHETSDTIESIVEHLPNLRHLQITMSSKLSNAYIFPLLCKCPTLETITIALHSNHEMGPMNSQFFTEFIDIMQKSCAKIKFIDEEKTVGVVSKKGIVWRNKLMHWIGCDSSNSSSNLNLLDLANKTSESNDEQPCPFDLILGYLDLGSLHSLSSASRRSKQLVDSFVARHSHEQGIFTITDEFYSDGNVLDAFAEYVKNLRLNVFHQDFIEHLHTARNHLGYPYENVNKLWILTFYNRDYLDVRYLVFDHPCFDFDLFTVSVLYPELETLETNAKFTFEEQSDSYR